jgi:hypothetical protein
MENIDKKFDRMEKLVSRWGKLVLKIVGIIVGIVLASVLAYTQLHNAIDDAGIHDHEYFEGVCEDCEEEFPTEEGESCEETEQYQQTK